MRSGSLQAEILSRFSEAPYRRCVAFYRTEEGFRWQSRQQVYRSAVAAANQLKSDGLRAGDVCVIVLPSGEEAVAVLVGTLLLGAVPLLVAPPTLVGGNLDLATTLRSTLRRTRARLAVCSSSLEPVLPWLERSVPGTRFIVASQRRGADSNQTAFTPVLPRVTDIAAMQLTSGTTGLPRICVWDHKAILAALDGMTAAMALSTGDICLNWTPLYHDMGLVNNFLLCLVRGIPLALLSPQEFIRRPALWLRGLAETGGTVTWSPNFGFAVTTRKAQDDELSGVRLDHVRAFWNAAERIHRETLDMFYRRFGVFGVRRDSLKTNYGCAENVGGATFSGFDEPTRQEDIDRQLLEERGVAKRTVATDAAQTVPIVSAGRPHPGVSVRILSPRGRVLPDGRVGEICLETASRMLGYHRNARETRRAFSGGLLHTGDLGYLRAGELFWTGRLRERITVHGKKLDPSAFEDVLASTPGLREGCFVAFGIPDQRLGTERVIVVSEVRLLVGQDIDGVAATIRGGCFRHLGITPYDIVLVRPGTLTKTSSGKRRNRYFRKLYLTNRLADVRLVEAPAALSAETRRERVVAG